MKRKLHVYIVYTFGDEILEPRIERVCASREIAERVAEKLPDHWHATVLKFTVQGIHDVNNICLLGQSQLKSLMIYQY